MKRIAQIINWDSKANDSLELRNKNGKRICIEISDEYWSKREYDSEGNQIHYENSKGFWAKREYDSKGNQIYYEDLDGYVEDNRHKSSVDSVIEIDGVKYKLIKL